MMPNELLWFDSSYLSKGRLSRHGLRAGKLRCLRIFLSALLVILFSAMQALAGSVTGTIYFRGKVPAPEQFTVIKDTALCGAGIRTIEWVRSKEGKLSGTVVTIENISDGFKGWKRSAVSPQLKQKDCAFVPYLDVIQNGAELQVTNDDLVLHNIHAYEILGRARRTMFNHIQHGKGTVYKKVVKARVGRWMELECDAHNFMHGWRFLARNPYYSVTGDDGRFKIAGLSPGKYSVAAYHPVLGTRRSTVEILGESGEVNFTFLGDQQE